MCIASTYLILLYGNDISICGGRARPPGPGGSMKYRFVYLNVVTVFQLSLTLYISYVEIHVICVSMYVYSCTYSIYLSG